MKHPLKQKKVNVDSLANAAYEKWYAKNVQLKQKALSDAAEVKKFDDTYLQRDEGNPVYNTQRKPSTTSQKILGWVGDYAKMVLTGSGGLSSKIWDKIKNK